MKERGREQDREREGENKVSKKYGFMLFGKNLSPIHGLPLNDSTAANNFSTEKWKTM